MWTYLPQLDGLRSIAVYLVLLYHSGPADHAHWFAGGGFIGVDIFFVLSGFLVSNVILSEVDRNGRFSLGGFYARRVRRLLPAAVLVIVATSVVFVLVTDVVRRIEMVGDARAALLYFANWHFLGQSTDYFSQDLKPSPFLHFWSLAIEEQFYVFFPILIALLLRSRAAFARRASLVLGLLFVASVGSQLFWSVREPNHAYFGTDAKLYQLLAGVLLTLLLRSRPTILAGRTAPVLVLLGLGGIGVFGSGLLHVATTWRGFAATAASVALIGGLTVLPKGWLTRLLSRPVPVYLGKISYGTYLWHWPVILVIRELFTVGPYTVAVLAFVLASGLAALSYQIFEMPIRTQPWLASRRWTTVLAGVTTSALVAAFLVGPVLDSNRRPALVAFKGSAASGSVKTGNAASGKIPGDGPVPTGIDWKKAVHDLGHSKNCSADQPEACIVVKNNGPLVLVVGDSFANMLGPMFVKLAQEHGFSLAQNVVQGCPWPSDLDDTGQNNELRAACALGRDQWYPKALSALKPALVVLVMKPRDPTPGWARLMKSRSGKLAGVSLSKLMYTTMADTVKQIRTVAPRVLMIQSVMDANPDRPLDCLAQATRLSQCAVRYPLQAPPSDGYMQALAASVPGVSTISINRVVCPTPPICVPYRDGQIVFRDRHHIMTGFAVANRARIWDLITASGAMNGS